MGAVPFDARFHDSAPVGVGPVKALAMPPGIGDAPGDAGDPLERIEDETGSAGARVRGCFQDQVAVPESLQRVHSQGGAGDIAAWRFESGKGGAIIGLQRQSSGRAPQQADLAIPHPCQRGAAATGRRATASRASRRMMKVSL